MSSTSLIRHVRDGRKPRIETMNRLRSLWGAPTDSTGNRGPSKFVAMNLPIVAVVVFAMLVGTVPSVVLGKGSENGLKNRLLKSPDPIRQPGGFVHSIRPSGKYLVLSLKRNERLGLRLNMMRSRHSSKSKRKQRHCQLVN